ncbi:hypothetical protein BGX38DRAFT_1210956 [Terfezia claveryi]|nr:hypothetical protein BGX38DRAFT_1210956 [Terfezia claveryi]
MSGQSRPTQGLYHINMPADTAFNAAYYSRPAHFTRNQHAYALQPASDGGYHFYTQLRGNVHAPPQGMTQAQMNTMRHVMGPCTPTVSAPPIAASMNAPMAHTYRHMADPTMVVTPQLQFEHLAFEQQRHQQQLSLQQGLAQGMHGYPAPDPMRITMNLASRSQFNIPNTMYNPQIMGLANSNGFNWQLQSGQRQNNPAVFSEQSRRAGPRQAQDIHLDPMLTHSRPSTPPLSRLSQSQGEKIQTPAPSPSPSPPVATEEAVPASKNDWSLASPHEKERVLLNGEVHQHSPGIVQSCKRKIHSESLEIATAVAPQRKRARTEKRKERKRATPASACDDELIITKVNLLTPSPSPLTTTKANPLTPSSSPLTITKVNLLTPSSSPITRTSGGEVTTGAGILTPSPSASPPANNLRTSTTKSPPVSSNQVFPKTRGKSGRTTTYTNFTVAPYDISRANEHLAHNMPRKIAMSRKRWITNPDEFPRLERPIKQGVEKVGDDPDAVFEVDERGGRVLPASAHPQGKNAAAEAEDDQSGETDPYEDEHDEVSWHGSGELVVEEEVTHVRSVHEKTSPAAAVPTSQGAPISLPRKGQGVKLTEEEKKARRRQRDRERYQRKNAAAAGTHITPPKKPVRPSPTTSNKKGVAKRTPAKSRDMTALNPSATRQQADESSGDKEDDYNEEFDIWEQIGLEIQKLPPVDCTAELEMDKDAGGNSSIWGSTEEGQPHALEAEHQRGMLPRSEGPGEVVGENSDDDYITSLFEE